METVARLLLLGLITSACASNGATTHRDASPPAVQRVTLLSRSGHEDYGKATFSFEHGLRDDPENAVTRNDWDVEFGNGGDTFGVTMVVDDRSRIADLGAHTWADLASLELPDLVPYASPRREPRVPAVVGHAYLVHTRDSETDLEAVFRVEALVPGDSVDLTWRLLTPDEAHGRRPAHPLPEITAAITDRLQLQVVGSSGSAGNPKGIDLSGCATGYVELIAADPRSPLRPSDLGWAYSSSVVVPPGKVLVVRSAWVRSGAEPAGDPAPTVALVVGGERVIELTDGSSLEEGTWKGGIRVRPGEESSVYLEVRGPAWADAHLVAELVDA